MARVEEFYEQAGVVHTDNPSCPVCTPIGGYELTPNITITGVNQVNIIELED